MEVLIGFVVGYYMGAKGGREKLDELQQAYQTIARSEEFKALVTVGGAMLTNAIAQRTSGNGNPHRAGFDVGQLVGDQLKNIAAAALGAGRNT